MDQSELGAFLRTRRERLDPSDVGIPVGARRRTPGLRREEVAVMAHISTEYLIRLEQGRAPRPSAEVLAAIAAALRLTAPERDHLNVLAGAVSATRRHQREVRPSIRDLLERLPLTAGIVLSAGFEVLAWNALAAELMGDFATLSTADRNLARRAFLPAEADLSSPLIAADTALFQMHVVKELRAVAARYPEDPDIGGLVTELHEGSGRFRALWQRHDVDAAPSISKTFVNPDVGFLTLDCDSMRLVDGDQQVVLYSAPAGSSAAVALHLLEMLSAGAAATT